MSYMTNNNIETQLTWKIHEMLINWLLHSVTVSQGNKPLHEKYLTNMILSTIIS